MFFIISLLFTKIGIIFTDYLLCALLLGSGIFLSIKTHFVQIRHFSAGIKNMFSGLFSRDKNKDSISPFAALTTALAAQLGTGNIVGAGAAVITGGPGAIFWMWLCAFFSMSLAFGEGVLAQKTKLKDKNGEITGGTAYYINYAFNNKIGSALSRCFALFSTIGLGFTGVGVQANSICTALKEALNIKCFVSGIIITLLAGYFILKGTKKIARFSEKTIPLITTLYVGMCLAVLVINIKKIPRAVYLIFACAFNPRAVFGGSIAFGLRDALFQGVKRGLFTNEAGIGSAPNAYCLGDAHSPYQQGTLAIAGVFIDTFVMLSLTALSIITVIFCDGFLGGNITGSKAVSLAFSCVLGEKGAEIFIALSIFFFAFASILGWNLYGKTSCTYLFSKKSEGIYIFSSLLFVFIGAISNSDIIWNLTDFFNCLMVLTNIPALIKCNKTIYDEIKKSN